MKFDQFKVGQMYTTEPVTITEEAIFEFAEKYDPQYLHLDKEAAKASSFGNIIASGYHTLLSVWKKFVRLGILGSDTLGGVGVDHLRWVRPVYPDDQLIGEFTITDKRLLSDGKRGLVSFKIVIKNHKDVEVMTLETKGIFRK